MPVTSSGVAFGSGGKDCYSSDKRDLHGFQGRYFAPIKDVSDRNRRRSALFLPWALLLRSATSETGRQKRSTGLSHFLEKRERPRMRSGTFFGGKNHQYGKLLFLLLSRFLTG